MKLFLEPIDVAEKNGQPVRFCWRGHLYVVENVLETWTSRTQWWSADDKRKYYLLLTNNGVMEIYTSKTGWMLSRLLD